MRLLFTFYDIILATAIIAASFVGAVDVGSCEEFAAVDRKTETEVTITNADFACDEYTRVSIRSDMVLKSTVGLVTFSNFSLKIYESLTVEPDVIFTGIVDVDKNGGAVKVDLSASLVFQGTAEFTGVSILPREVDLRIYRKGGALHNKGDVTFEKYVRFENCYNERQEGQQTDEEGNSLYDASSGGGGAIYNHVKGTMTFLDGLNMTGNIAHSYFDANRGEGGAIFNRGDIIVDGDAYFANNRAQEGGAIFQERWGTLEFNGGVSFVNNLCRNLRGGAIRNDGGVITLNGASVFDDNFASSTGDGGNGGGIYNYDGGNITFKGLSQFTSNWAWIGGAIYNREREPDGFEDDEGRAYKIPILTLSDETIFEDNFGDDCPDIAYLQSEGLVCGP